MHTHTGYNRCAGHVHTGRLHNHQDYRGRCHALNGCANIYSGAIYTALCGETVRADHDGYAFNVAAVGDEAALPSVQQVSCKRCLKRIK